MTWGPALPPEVGGKGQGGISLSPKPPQVRQVMGPVCLLPYHQGNLYSAAQVKYMVHTPAWGLQLMRGRTISCPPATMASSPEPMAPEPSLPRCLGKGWYSWRQGVGLAQHIAETSTALRQPRPGTSAGPFIGNIGLRHQPRPCLGQDHRPSHDSWQQRRSGYHHGHSSAALRHPHGLW